MAICKGAIEVGHATRYNSREMKRSMERRGYMLAVACSPEMWSLKMGVLQWELKAPGGRGNGKEPV